MHSCSNSSIAMLQCSHGPWKFKRACACVPASQGDVNRSVRLSPGAQAYGSVPQCSSPSVGGIL